MPSSAALGRGRGASLLVLIVVACTAEPASQDPAPEDDRLLVLPTLAPCPTDAAAPQSVRVATWNISAGRVSSLSQVQDMLIGLDADAVLLQEVDVGVRRTFDVDQPRVLAQALGMEYAFGASLEFDGGDFGLAVLSRLPFSAARRVSLASEGGSEPRIALDVTLCAGSVSLRLIDVHADFVPEANMDNLADLAATVDPTVEIPTILAGDFNATAQTEGMRELLDATGFVDVFDAWDPGPTRDGQRIDYMLIDPARSPAVTQATRVETDASDHTPLWLDLTLPQE